MKIIPTIGRVIWVHNSGTGSDQPEPAFICYVHNDRLINVGGFSVNGKPFSITSLRLLVEDEEIPAFDTYATWMPYQLTQFKKESPEGKL